MQEMGASITDTQPLGDNLSPPEIEPPTRSELQTVRVLVRSVLKTLEWDEVSNEIGWRFIAWCEQEIGKLEDG